MGPDSQTHDGSPAGGVIETDIPARLDRLPWGRFHWLLVTALGVTWVLDGLEVTVVSSIAPTLQDPSTLGLSARQLGLTASAYLAGAIVGALVFGHLTDRLGRKRLFSVTLGIYLAGAVLTAFSWDLWSFLLFRVIVGLAIGGEYAAINSAIDELIPARLRGRVDLAINGTFWLGAMAGSAVSVLLLNPAVVDERYGWRLAFGLGGFVGLAMLIARRHVPESPRWLLTHGRPQEAEEVMRQIEASAAGGRPPPPVTQRVTIHPGVEVGLGTIAHTLFVRYRTRALVGLVLIASQAFFYNGVLFTVPLVLNHYLGVAQQDVGRYLFCISAANLLGPLLLGHFFDTVGRRKMIAATYGVSAVILVVTELLFLGGRLSAAWQTAWWMATFFFASSAASAGYLTVSEIFPVEMRALAIALFYALGTAIGGLGAPALFGQLIQTERPGALVGGYLAGAALMLAAAAVEWFLGVDAERKSLEDVAAPLSSEAPGQAAARKRGAARTGAGGATASVNASRAGSNR